MSAFLLLPLVTVVSLAAPWIYSDDSLSMVARPFLWPGQDWDYPLGTDSLGRDVAAGLVWGARISLLVGFAAMGLGVAVGIIVGALGGYFGGGIDNTLQRVTDIVQTMASFVLLLVLVATFKPSVQTVTAGIAVVTWPTVARLVRAEFRSLREKDFVMAATVELDPAKRVAEFRKFQDIIAQDVLDLTLHNLENLTIYNRRVRDHTVGADGLNGNLANVWLAS